MDPVWRKYTPHILFILLVAAYALAQQRVVITGLNQSGQPSIAYVNDAGQLWVQSAATGPTQVVPAACTTSVQTAVSVDTTAGGTTTPASQTASRSYVTICNSKANTTGLIKCRVDGSAPVYASGAGDVLDIGDCIVYAVANSVSPKCISSAGTVVTTTYECVP